jgi:serine/threonine-protein kinase
VPLLALLTGAAIAAVVFNGLVGGQRSGAVAPAVAADTGTRTFTLVGANFVGRPVNEVAIQLAALGLTVERVQSVTSAVAPSTVVAIDPAGSPLRAGDTVTVSYAVRPPTYDTRARSSVNQETVRRGSTAAAPARTTAPEATTRATPTADAPAASSTDDGAASSSSSTDPGSSAPGSSGSGSDSSSAAPATSSSAPSTTSSTPSRSSTSSSGHGYHDDGDDEDG